MALTAKAKRRLTLLLVIVVVFAVGVAGLYAYRKSHEVAQAQKLRERGSLRSKKKTTPKHSRS